MGGLERKNVAQSVLGCEVMKVSDIDALPLDAKGYLLESELWSPAFAEVMAARDDLTLTPTHWDVIDFLRAYHERYALAPPMRLLVKELGRQFGPDKASSRYLYQLFPDGPARQACRYAGLPKPVSCI